jgi:hypothetical protein
MNPTSLGGLTSEQATVVNAGRNLTAAERDRIDRRYENLHVSNDDNDSLRGVGPSKGKGIDPKNWGALDFEPSELDLDAQRGAIENWNAIHEVNRLDNELTLNVGQDTPKQRKKSNYHTRIESVSDEQAPKASAPAAANKNASLPKFTPMSDTLMDRIANAVKGHCHPHGRQERQGTEIQPVSQIAPGSYLGQAMTNLDRNQGLDEPSDPSDDSSSSSSSSSDSEDGDGDNEGGHHKPSRSRSKARLRLNASKKTLLKPLPPLDYDGAADARSYHRFVTEGTDYVVSGRVDKRQ